MCDRLPHLLFITFFWLFHLLSHKPPSPFFVSLPTPSHSLPPALTAPACKCQPESVCQCGCSSHLDEDHELCQPGTSTWNRPSSSFRWALVGLGSLDHIPVPLSRFYRPNSDLARRRTHRINSPREWQLTSPTEPTAVPLFFQHQAFLLNSLKAFGRASEAIIDRSD